MLRFSGKDRPKELPSPPQNRKTTEILLSLCKSMAGTGKIVVLDSEFCVLSALVQLKKIGDFAHAVIKKRRYWPTFIPGEAIENHFKDKEIGAVDCLSGELLKANQCFRNERARIYNEIDGDLRIPHALPARKNSK